MVNVLKLQVHFVLSFSKDMNAVQDIMQILKVKLVFHVQRIPSNRKVNNVNIPWLCLKHHITIANKHIKCINEGFPILCLASLFYYTPQSMLNYANIFNSSLVA